MSDYSFLVKGSAPDPCKVVLSIDGESLFLTCSCQAGKNGMICKHRLNIVEGDSSGVVGGDIQIIASLPSMVGKNRAWKVLEEMRFAEKNWKQFKRKYLT